MSYWFVFTGSHQYPSGSLNSTETDNCEVTSPPVKYSGSVFGTLTNPATGVRLYRYAYSQSTIGSTGSFINRWSSLISGNVRHFYDSNYSYNRSTSTYSGSRNYAGNLIRSNNEITNATILSHGVKLTATTVSGKWAPKALTILSPIQYGGVDIPITFALGDVTYDHMVFPAWFNTYDGWNYTGTTSMAATYALTMSYNKYSFCGYKEAEFDDNDNILTWFTTAYNTDALKEEYQGAIIDFGSLPQEVPEFFLTWLEANYDAIYDQTYTIKDSVGHVTRAELTDAPPMTSATLSYVGNQATLVLKGINNRDYTLTWEFGTPVGKQFAGLGTDVGSLDVPLGTTSVSWNGMTLYEFYETYKPPSSTFDIAIYHNTAEPNRVDKTSFLTLVNTLWGALREECSIITPSILIKATSLPSFNYAYIPEFNRFYFVTGITSVRTGLWRIDLNVDVLMTYKSGILDLSAVIGRQEFSYNPDLVDSELPVEKQDEITVEEISSTAFSTELTGADVYNYVLTVVGP